MKLFTLSQYLRIEVIPGVIISGFQIMSIMRTITVSLTGAAGIYGGLVLYRYVRLCCRRSLTRTRSIAREYFVKVQYKGNEQLFGKTAIVTGANTGLGREVAHDLARRGRRTVGRASAIG